MNDKNPTSDCNMHEALISHLYDEATPDESRRVQGHLKDCATCSQELAAFQQVRGMLQQWELAEDMPSIRVHPGAGKKSMWAVLKELLTVTPVWAKALGAVAAMMLVFAVLGTEVTVGRAGFTVSLNLLGKARPAAQPAQTAAQSAPNQPRSTNLVPAAQVALTEDQVKEIVNKAILQRDQQQKSELKQELVRMETQLRTNHSSDLQRIALRVEEQRDRIRVLERDIDRREGLDLSDVLFSPARNPRAQSDGTDGGQ